MARAAAAAAGSSSGTKPPPALPPPEAEAGLSERGRGIARSGESLSPRPVLLRTGGWKRVKPKRERQKVRGQNPKPKKIPKKVALIFLPLLSLISHLPFSSRESLAIRAAIRDRVDLTEASEDGALKLLSLASRNRRSQDERSRTGSTCRGDDRRRWGPSSSPDDGAAACCVPHAGGPVSGARPREKGRRW